MDLDGHLAAFVDAFVVAIRRERWKDLLLLRRNRAFRDSSKLMDHLDTRFCRRVDGAFGLARDVRGVFYDFSEEPHWTSLQEARERGEHHDAIFSVVPGKVAIHWSHEGWSWLCRR